eukprot:GHVS01027030.1.p2 GENE.GHVS01027030.1~~GHVS01027030.1.p2  ORF type:complete len:146 (+),score=39.79 GHVS01027030.1:66-503(+)
MATSSSSSHSSCSSVASFSASSACSTISTCGSPPAAPPGSSPTTALPMVTRFDQPQTITFGKSQTITHAPSTTITPSIPPPSWFFFSPSSFSRLLFCPPTSCLFPPHLPAQRSHLFNCFIGSSTPLFLVTDALRGRHLCSFTSSH